MENVLKRSSVRRLPRWRAATGGASWEEGMMRKFIVGMIAIGVLSCAGQVQAQNNGTGDPLGLIASAAIQPFWSSGANFTVIEITSPVNFNTDLDAHFFDNTCAKDQSISLPVTQNGLLLFTPDDIGIAYNGLAVIGRSANSLTLTPIPLTAPIHVRGHWVNFANDHIRVLDPISVTAAESSPQQTWNPLRSGATFVSPLEGADFQTTIFLVCPGSTVTGALPTTSGFPEAPRIAFGTTAATSGIVGVIYDDDENPRRNIQVPCVCITALPVLTINSVYGNASATGSTGLFYTELFTLPGTPAGTPPVTPPPAAFTGYRSIVISDAVWPGGQGDKFGRLHNASSSALQGIVPAVPQR